MLNTWKFFFNGEMFEILVKFKYYFLGYLNMHFLENKFQSLLLLKIYLLPN